MGKEKAHARQRSDLPKSSEAYEAHRELIQDLLCRARGQYRTLIRTVLDRSCKRILETNVDAEQPVPTGNLPRLTEIIRDTHVNCDGVERLCHIAGMESFRREHDGKPIAELRELLREVTSAALSIRNFALNKHPVDYRKTIQSLDWRLRESVEDGVETPSLVPYLLTPESSITQVKKFLGGKRFRDPEILMDLAELHASDEHILHSVCMAFATSGMPEHIEEVLKIRAVERYLQFKQHALTPYLQENPDHFVVFIIGLVESGQTARAITWCEKSFFRSLLRENIGLALKYAAALRHQGFFQRAKTFLEDVRDNGGLEDRRLAVEYKMALAGCPDIMPVSLDEFRRRYPQFA